MIPSRDPSKDPITELLGRARIITTEAQGLSVISEWANYFHNKHGMKLSEVVNLAQDWKQYITIPITAFSSKLGGLETVAFFLHEAHQLTYAQIATLLSRDQRTIWTAHQKAQKKIMFSMRPKSTNIQIPVSELGNRKHTVLEIVCHLLKTHYGLANVKIAKLLQRSPSFVWITLKRYEEKENA